MSDINLNVTITLEHDDLINTRGAWIKIADNIIASETKNSWTDYGMFIANSDIIGEPVVDENLVYITGRSGPIDLTESVAGIPIFKSRPIKVKFIVDKNYDEATELITELRKLYSGKRVKLNFSNDPDWYYTGRASFTTPTTQGRYTTFLLEIPEADPYKVSIPSGDPGSTASTPKGYVTKQISFSSATYEEKYYFANSGSYGPIDVHVAADWTASETNYLEVGLNGIISRTLKTNAIAVYPELRMIKDGDYLTIKHGGSAAAGGVIAMIAHKLRSL